MKESQHIAALEVTTEDDFTLRINAVDLKNPLGDVETNGRNRLYK